MPTKINADDKQRELEKVYRDYVREIKKIEQEAIKKLQALADKANARKIAEIKKDIKSSI
jgi:hypothetical protein